MVFSLASFAAEESSSYIANIGVQSNLEGLERVKQNLVAPPFMPNHQQTYSGKPRIIKMTMVIEEKEIENEESVFIESP